MEAVQMDDLKRCTKCGERKPRTDFYRQRRNKDGLRPRCIPCTKEDQQSDSYQDAQRNYWASKKGKAARKRYWKSDAKKATAKRWRESKKGQAYESSQRRKEWRYRYNRSAARKASVKRYEQSEKGQRNRKRIAQRHARRFPEKRKAKDTIQNEVKRGRMPRATELVCANCGSAAEHYHHHLGYAKKHWLDVIPVCAKCHRQEASPR